MHISDGILSPPILIGASIMAAAGVAQGLRKIEDDDLPKTALLTAAFFVASLVHVRIGPTSAHLILNGMAGIMLGWAAFPALLIGLLFQALLFGHGGVSVLGVNTLAIAAPAVATGLVFRRLVGRATPPRRAAIMAGLGAGLCVAATALFSAAALALSGREWLRTAQTLLVAHVFVMAGEAFLAYFIVAYLLRVRPALLLGERSGP